jgi:hypothetical protein
MSNKATIKDNHLYITYEYYDNGHQEGRKIIPLEDIECIKADIGVRGGMHTWSIMGYNPEYSERDWHKDNPRDVAIFSGGRKDTELIKQITKLLPDCKYIERVESGGSPW